MASSRAADGVARLAVLPPATWWGWPIVRRTMLIVASLLGIGVTLYTLLGSWAMTDAEAYWHAALRLREGAALYPHLADTQASEVYRYAPWFAALWVPLTYLPHAVASVLWQVLMVACAFASVIPAWRAGWLGRVAAIAIFGYLFQAALGGNVQPAITALLVYTIDGRRAGPVAVGIAASLKVVPILYAVTYLARRDCRSLAVSVGIAAVLWLPALAFGVGDYPTDIGTPFALWSLSPLLWAAVTVALVGWAYRAANGPDAWRIGSLAVTFGTPKFVAYDVSFLLVGWRRPSEGEDAAG